MLQYGDSFFPSGAVSFSWGLEALVDSGTITGALDVTSFVIGQLRGRWATFDRSVMSAAFASSASIDDVASVDRQTEMQTAAAEMRATSERIGRAMLSVFDRLGNRKATEYREWIREGRAHGHLPVMQGFLWAQSGLSHDDALALSAHTFCTGLLGAGIRLGCLTHIDAQEILVLARQETERLCSLPPLPLDDISTSGIEAEISIVRHAQNPTRMFSN